MHTKAHDKEFSCENSKNLALKMLLDACRGMLVMSPCDALEGNACGRQHELPNTFDRILKERKKGVCMHERSAKICTSIADKDRPQTFVDNDRVRLSWLEMSRSSLCRIWPSCLPQKSASHMRMQRAQRGTLVGLHNAKKPIRNEKGLQTGFKVADKVRLSAQHQRQWL
jgi:hypothetical protein